MLRSKLSYNLTRYRQYFRPTLNSAIFILRNSVEEPKQEESSITPRLYISPLERASRDVQEQIWDEILAFALYVDPGIVHKLSSIIPLAWRAELLSICKKLRVSYDG
jgi:hypothetical protein